jgi:hypothetical protein
VLHIPGQSPGGIALQDMELSLAGMLCSILALAEWICPAEVTICLYRASGLSCSLCPMKQ